MIDQLIAKIKKTNAPIVVGLDPMWKYIPEQIQKAGLCGVRRDLKGRGRGHLAVQQGHRGCGLADLIPAVKPQQIAMYEQFAIAGHDRITRRPCASLQRKRIWWSSAMSSAATSVPPRRPMPWPISGRAEVWRSSRSAPASTRRFCHREPLSGFRRHQSVHKGLQRRK